MKIKLIFLFFIFSLFVILNFVKAENKVCVYSFWGSGCPHCAEEKKFLRELEGKYTELEVKDFEIYYNDENKQLWENIAKAFGTVTSGVPMTFIDNKAFIGFAEGNLEFYHPRYNAYIGYNQVIESQIIKCIEMGGCDCPTVETPVEKPPEVNQTDIIVPVTPVSSQRMIVPFIGEISLSASLIFLGAILGFFDGALNPCALSVIFFLFAYLMSIGSRKRSLIMGTVYSLTVFTVYFLFMYGALNVIVLTGYIDIIKFVAGTVIIIAGLIELKDFFFYGKGISLEIPKSAKPTIEKLIKIGTIPSTLLLGVFVSFVEIPCAGIFPFIYITILGERIASPTVSLFYLLWYSLFFIIPLIVLTFIFYFGLVKVEEAEKKRLKSRKYMRLIAGAIMIFFGLWMLIG
jgi:glutaredoxin